MREILNQAIYNRLQFIYSKKLRDVAEAIDDGDHFRSEMQHIVDMLSFHLTDNTD